MRAREMYSKIFWGTLAVIILPTVSAHILCFCNSPSCPQAVCKSNQRCFTKLLREAGADGNVSTSVMYGCSEALNSSDVCLDSSQMICCDKELCNMPNMLRKVTKIHQRRAQVHATEHAPKVDENDTKCTSSMPAMRVASVVAPSVLILTVICLSLGMCYKMSRYEKLRNMECKSVINKSSSSGKLFQKVRELKRCSLLAGSSVEWNTPEVCSTEVGISSDSRELLSSPHSV
ncbi:hypothetical protein ACROYT_G026734 [Oculina patagonica]